VAQRTSQSARRAVLLSGLALALFAWALAAGIPVGIRGEWTWLPNRIPVRLASSLATGLALVLAAWLFCRSGRWERMGRWSRLSALILFVLLTFAFQAAILNAAGLPLVSAGEIIASPVATTYYGIALELGDVRSWVGSYPSVMGDLPYHAKTHPPGFVLFFLGVQRACAALIQEPGELLHALAERYRVFGIGPSPSEAAAAIVSAFLIALVGALSLLPVYGLGRQLVGSGGAACALPMLAAMPALVLLAASPDQILLMVTALTLWLCYSAWRARSWARAFLGGAALGLAFFLSFAALALAAWLAAWAAIGLAGCRNRRAAAKQLLLAGAAGLAGFLAFHLLLYFALDYRPLPVISGALAAHREVTALEQARIYWKWLLMNPLEASVFAGLPLVVAALWSLREAAGDSRRGRWRAFLLSWLAVLVLLNLSGTVRGEVGRIWLFLMWPLALAAGDWLSRQRNRHVIAALLVVFQVCQVLLMRGYLMMYNIR